MLKSKFGPITNPKTGKSKDIVVKFLTKENAKDMIIGGGLIAVGFAYLAISMYDNGAKAFEMAEYETLKSLDLFK